MSWPVAGTLMIEPTESESLNEIDKFCNALINIKKEVLMVQNKIFDEKDNPLKNAPHTHQELTGDVWEHKYTREQAAFPLKYLKEYEVPNISDFELGQVINVQKFTVGEFVDITGKSIGKGFAGNQKRHNFSRGPMTHGSKNHREPGSIGQGSTPARVFPGKKMYGKLGDKQTTVSNLQILKIDTEENLLIVKGAVPGKPGNLLSIKPTKRV
jgi:50S ribosomal protein uL3